MLDWPEADPLSYGWPFHRNGGSVVAAYRQCAFGRRYPGQGKLWAGGSDIQPDSGGAWEKEVPVEMVLSEGCIQNRRHIRLMRL